MGQDVKGISFGLLLEDGNELLLVVVGVADGQRADGPSFGMILPISECQGAPGCHAWNGVEALFSSWCQAVLSLLACGITGSEISPTGASISAIASLRVNAVVQMMAGGASSVLVSIGITWSIICPARAIIASAVCVP
jgi:hypothetical protein